MVFNTHVTAKTTYLDIVLMVFSPEKQQDHENLIQPLLGVAGNVSAK